MKSKLNAVRSWLGAALLACCFSANNSQAQLPPDFPAVTVTTHDSNSVAPGYVFLAVAVPVTNGAYYAMILKNDGTPVWYKRLQDEAYDFKLLPNGRLHYAEFLHPHSWTGGGDAVHHVLDQDGGLQELITPGNRYVAESHEFQMLPNGNALVTAYYRTQIDLSKVAAGGYPNALLSGTTIQELDAQRNVVWQWRSWDHFTLKDYLPALAPSTLSQAVVNAFHVNTVRIDSDGNMLVSNYSVDVWKINRQTGEVMWRLGGPGNQFTFVGVNPAEAVTHFAGHDVTRLDNGNIIIYTNGDRQGTRTSKVYEYRLDETNKVATLVWQYTPDKPVYAWHRGNAQRLPNGNTFIGWGGVTGQQGAACTEVTPQGKVVFELKFNDPYLESYRAYRFLYPSDSEAIKASVFEVATGNRYPVGDTGVALDVSNGGGGYNSLRVTREPYAPLDPLFNGRAPRLMPLRVKMEESAITKLEAVVEFDAASFKFENPAALTVYYRPRSGQGVFVAQPTTYNPVTKFLKADLTLTAEAGELGEFAFGWPDVPEVAYAPILAVVENDRGVKPFEVIVPGMAEAGKTYSVNQDLPVTLSWSPRGFAGWYELQISTNQDYSTPTVNVGYQTDAFYVWNSVPKAQQCHYRVRVWNSTGPGPWAEGAFKTEEPSVQVSAPVAGEVWKRGIAYFVRWDDNLAENVTIELYKGDTLARTITANAPSTGAFKWSVGLDLVPGSDYTIKVLSATNSQIAAVSGPFTILDAPVLDQDALSWLPDGQVQITVALPGAIQATLLGTSDLSLWEQIQTVPVADGLAVFTDPAAASHSTRFYRVRVP